MADAAVAQREALGVAAAREALLAWVRDAGAAGRRFLQARLLALPGNRYEIRHAADGALPLDDLLTSADPHRAREIAQTDAAGEHRPLKTAPNLRRGWALLGLDAQGLWTALDYLYPTCAVHWYAGSTGSLRTTPWEQTAERQSGMYAAVGQLPPQAVERAVAACCGNTVCLRSVAWRDVPAPETAADPEAAHVPCPEACSMFVSFARAVLGVEREPRTEVPGLGLGTLAPSEVEQLRALVAAAAAGELEPVREGEFSAPLNRRRLRYLALRMDPPVDPPS